MTLERALDGVQKWAATVAASLAVALVVGGLNLHSDVQAAAMRVEAVTVLAQATDNREQSLEKSVAGVDAKLEGLQRDINSLGSRLEGVAKDAQSDRAEILQAIGRLQGAQDRPNHR